MNKIFTLLLFIAPFIFLTAQDSTQIDSPKIVSKLKIGNTVDFDTKGIKFVKVIEDSRCPKGVSCMWEGEVKIVIGIYQDKKMTEEKELIFNSKATHPDNMKELIVTKTKTIYAYRIGPYPSSEKPINPLEYYLELVIK